MDRDQIMMEYHTILKKKKHKTKKMLHMRFSSDISKVIDQSAAVKDSIKDIPYIAKTRALLSNTVKLRI